MQITDDIINIAANAYFDASMKDMSNFQPDAPYYDTRLTYRVSMEAALTAALPLIRDAVLEEERGNYSGAMADLDALVDAFYRACPDNYFLNANYPREGSKEVVKQWVSDRDMVLEEAAKVCERNYVFHANLQMNMQATGARQCAQAIRNMKEKQS